MPETGDGTQRLSKKSTPVSTKGRRGSLGILMHLCPLIPPAPFSHKGEKGEFILMHLCPSSPQPPSPTKGRRGSLGILMRL